jgi:flagellar hook-basal body complex protein FliE
MKITGASSLSHFGAGTVTGATVTDAFGDAVRGAIEKIEQSQQSADAEIVRSVTGESPDLHRTVVALQTADLSFQLALQIRNKVINAYEEIMRMQV